MLSSRGKQHGTRWSRSSSATAGSASQALKHPSASAAQQLATSTPRPGLRPDQLGSAFPHKATKAPSARTGGRVVQVKPGKARGRGPVPKCGGTAKPAKLHLPSPAALPTPVPGRNTLKCDRRRPPRHRSRATVLRSPPLRAARPAPTRISTSDLRTATGESPGGDDTPGIDGAGVRVGGSHEQQAKAAVQKALVTSLPRTLHPGGRA